ncbi:MAG: VCBS repeat-containing protein, partial [Armatimonadetes bacterium]|nr:VCBS repeat-containing protein [Armatimonadota bacterium]
GGIRSLQTEWKQHGVEMFRVLGYRYLEYRDSSDTIPPLTDDGFTDAELLKIVSVWNAYEEFPAFSHAERLQLTNLLYEMARISEGPFSRYLFGSPHNLPHEEIATRIKSLKPEIRWNHQTFPAASLYWAGRYFWDYYRLPEAKDWLSFSAFLFEGQKPCFKPRCDCWGYQDITMIETFRYAVATEDQTYLKSGLIDKFLELRLMSYDNQGSPCGYGDSGGYLGTFGPDFYEEGVRWWTSLGYQPNRKQLSAEALSGLKVHEMEPHFYEAFKGNQTMPLGKCFDKLTLREKVDPSRAYLLLDGISGGNHGHTDGNSIVRFTDNGRVWLAEGDYLYGDMKDHNTVTLTRNAVGGKPDSFSTLESRVALPSFAATQTRTDHYNGATWDRHILWLRDRDLFFVFDEVKAKEAGVYDIKSRYRVRGDAEIKGPLLIARQKDDERFYLWDGAGSERRLSTDERDGETNWRSYPFSKDPSTKLLWHRWNGRMKPGDSRCLAAAFHAAGPNEVKRLEVAPGGPGVEVIHGPLEAVVGMLPPSQPGMPQVMARQYSIGPEQISWVQGSKLVWGPLTITANPPVDLDLNLKTGHGVIVAKQVTELTLSGSAKLGLVIDGKPARAQTVVGGVRVVIPAGRRTISAGRRFSALSPVLARRFAALWNRLSSPAAATTPQQSDKRLKVEWEQSCASLITALWTADLDDDGDFEILTGTSTGLLEVRDIAGRTLWSHQFDARINDLCSVDLDGDGKQEVLCGVEDQTAYALKEGGTVLWQASFEPDASQGGGAGHVRVVTTADFDNDGKPEVAVGCANSWFYVLDSRGQVRWKRQMQHKASAIGIADLDGDGFKELLCGYTYQARQIVDFSKSGWDQIRIVGGCISGCQTIASGDVDGDGKPEAIFGDKDGRLLAGKKGPPYNVEPVFQVMLGDDEITRVVAADLDGDKKDELICASRSNFVAAVGEGGKVRWVFPAESEVVDLAVGSWPGQPGPVIAAGTRDHRVHLLSAAGSLIGLLTMKNEVNRVCFSGKAEGIRIVASFAEKVVAISAE